MFNFSAILKELIECLLANMFKDTFCLNEFVCVAGILFLVCFVCYQEDYELRIARRKIADDINKIKPIQALG